jgi:hypothetical protein
MAGCGVRPVGNKDLTMRRSLFGLFASWLFASVLLTGVFWSDAGVAAPRRVPAEVKATLERQPQLLDRVLGQVQTEAATNPQLYFVGFAGFGSQAVFKREVIAVRQLFDERFGTKGRSVALINHRSTAAEIPLANAANLERVLQHLRGVMDVERDTLFLFFTSHGDKGKLAVEFPRLGFTKITPDEIKSMLDRSGIRNRVIVVSACHSGSFIPTLADPQTLVIAAAHADRSSFGCEDRRQWTYFGDAYFNRALREGTSFRGAFARAESLIAAWEQREGLIPSLPQMAGGEALGPALSSIERQH